MSQRLLIGFPRESIRPCETREVVALHRLPVLVASVAINMPPMLELVKLRLGHTQLELHEPTVGAELGALVTWRLRKPAVLPVGYPLTLVVHNPGSEAVFLEAVAKGSVA